MKTIYKYPLEVIDSQEVELPVTAVVLSVQVQNGKPFLWALVDTTFDTEKRIIHIYGTGHPIEKVHRYVNTFQMMNGQLVFHVFQE